MKNISRTALLVCLATLPARAGGPSARTSPAGASVQGAVGAPIAPAVGIPLEAGPPLALPDAALAPAALLQAVPAEVSEAAAVPAEAAALAPVQAVSAVTPAALDAVLIEQSREEETTPGQPLQTAAETVEALSGNESIRELARPDAGPSAGRVAFDGGDGKEDGVTTPALAAERIGARAGLPLAESAARRPEGLADFEAKLAAIRRPDPKPSPALAALAALSGAAVMVAGFSPGPEAWFGPDAALRLKLLAFALAAPAAIIGLWGLNALASLLQPARRLTAARGALGVAPLLAFADGDPRNWVAGIAAFTILLLIASTVGASRNRPSAGPLVGPVYRRATMPEQEAPPRPLLTTLAEQVAAVVGAAAIWSAFAFLPGLLELPWTAAMKLRLILGLIGVPAAIAGLIGLGGLIERGWRVISRPSRS